MNRFGLQKTTYWRGSGAALGVALFIAGCSSYSPPIPISRNHIQAEPQAAAKDAGIPAPVRTGAFVPPPKPSAKPQTYSVVVNEVPVKAERAQPLPELVLAVIASKLPLVRRSTTVPPPPPPTARNTSPSPTSAISRSARA